MARKRVTDNGAIMKWMDEQLADPDRRARVDELLAAMTLEQELVGLRERRGLTQVQLAQRAGLSQPMIAKLESGKMKNYELRTLVRVAAALGVEVKVTFAPARRTRSRKKAAA